MLLSKSVFSGLSLDVCSSAAQVTICYVHVVYYMALPASILNFVLYTAIAEHGAADAYNN